MARQAIAGLCILLSGLGLAFFPTGKTNAQSDALHRISCSLSGSSVVVQFGMTKQPTNFGVIRPDEKILYLVDPAKGIDHLGKAYKQDTLVLKIGDLKGTKFNDGARSEEKVFGAAGRYTLLFEDANRAAYEDLHALSCDIDIPDQSLVQGDTAPANACAAGQATRTGLIADESGLPAEALKQVGCQPNSFCGQYGCCIRSLPG
jgi:hypothetical protein